MNERKNLIVTGHARHGKDTVSKLLADIAGYTFTTSSFILSPEVFSEIGEKYGYKDFMECWNDRGNHRSEWYEIITNYNTPDKSRLGTKIFSQYDIYCGIRNIDEFNALKNCGIVDFSLWVDASKRLPPEGGDSMTITKEDCDRVINNNGNLKDLEKEVRSFYENHLVALIL